MKRSILEIAIRTSSFMIREVATPLKQLIFYRFCSMVISCLICPCTSKGLTLKIESIATLKNRVNKGICL